MRAASPFDLSVPAGRIGRKSFRASLGVRSDRTVDRYLREPGFPQGKLEDFGRLQARTWSMSELVEARAWLDARRLPGNRGGHPRPLNTNLERARTARAEERDLLQLAGRILLAQGPQALADVLRPFGFHACGLAAVPKNARALTRIALVRALQLAGVSQ